MGLKETNPTRVAISQSILLKSDTHTQEVVATSSVARINKYINRF
jgi:hypothetical protein